METQIFNERKCAEQACASKKDRREEKWQTLYESLSLKWGEPLSGDIVSALRELYSIYTVETVKWYANLFDAEIGGFYYSNSARDFDEVTYNGAKYKLLPDLESTYQGDGFFYSSLVESDADSPLPRWVGDKIVRFVKGLQDKENGYFYHPQWGKELTDKLLGRRGRDLQWAVRLLRRYGSMPTYDTPLGTKGDGILADGSLADMEGAYCYCGKEDSEKADQGVAPHLVDKESFEKYLSEIEITFEKNKTSYSVGNRFEAQGLQILARDKVLAACGADYSLCDILKKWFDDRFNHKLGIWCEAERVGYCEVNGILKITAAYNNIRRPLPDHVASMKAAISLIMSDEDPVHVCSVLNPWYAITLIRENASKYLSDEKKETVSHQLSELGRELVTHYPELIRATVKKLKLFQKSDGSFSYYENNTAFCSQGMPVAHGAPDEGDLNATNICNFGIIGHIFAGLGENALPLFSADDRREYIKILEQNANKKRS